MPGETGRNAVGAAYWYGYEDGYADAKRGVVAVPDELGPYRYGYLDGVEAWRDELATGGVQGGGVAERQRSRV